MNAEIITIGDEILIGQIIDTNSAFLGKEFNKIGISVYLITSVQDEKDHILKALKEAEDNADIIIISNKSMAEECIQIITEYAKDLKCKKLTLGLSELTIKI